MIHYYYFPLPLLNNIIFLRESVTKQGGSKSLFLKIPFLILGFLGSIVPFLVLASSSSVWRRRAAAICFSLISFFPPLQPFFLGRRRWEGKGGEGVHLEVASSFLDPSCRPEKEMSEGRKKKKRESGNIISRRGGGGKRKEEAPLCVRTTPNGVRQKKSGGGGSVQKIVWRNRGERKESTSRTRVIVPSLPTVSPLGKQMGGQAKKKLNKRSPCRPAQKTALSSVQLTALRNSGQNFWVGNKTMPPIKSPSNYCGYTCSAQPKPTHMH